MSRLVDFRELVGKTFTKVERKDYAGEDAIIFTEETIFKDNPPTQYAIYHSQDCCESVNIEEISGDLECLVGHEILEAEERTESADLKESYDSATWTFYIIRTVKGTVNIRFYGTSNGYYSETASCYKLGREN